jgi:hypothetical protein
MGKITGNLSDLGPQCGCVQRIALDCKMSASSMQFSRVAANRVPEVHIFDAVGPRHTDCKAISEQHNPINYE